MGKLRQNYRGTQQRSQSQGKISANREPVIGNRVEQLQKFERKRKLEVKTEAIKKEEPFEVVQQTSNNNSAPTLNQATAPVGFRKQWRLILRNLPFSFNQDKLKEVMSKHGAVLECVLPPSKNDASKPAGFAFVQYMKASEAAAALNEINGQEVGGRKIAVDYAIPKDTFMTATVKDTSKQALDRFMTKSGNLNPQPQSTKQKTKPSTVKSTKQIEEKLEASDTRSSESEDEELDDNSGDEDKSDDDDDTTEEDDDSDEDSPRSKRPRHRDADKNSPSESDKPDEAVTEGRTVFVRNLSFDTDEAKLKEVMAKYGPLKYALVCKYPGTEHSKGSGFVQFENKADADKCVTASNQDLGLVVDGRRLSVVVAVSKQKAVEIDKTRTEKQPRDNRNLHLARVSLIRAGTSTAAGMSEMDAKRREQIDLANRQKIKNLHVFISATRLVVHNIPRAIDDAALRHICKNALNDKTARITECRVMRDMSQLTASGVGRSRGFAFVNFTQHAHALACLQKLNNNPKIFSDEKRPIVEFSLENRVALNLQQKRREMSQKAAAMGGRHPKRPQPAVNLVPVSSRKRKKAPSMLVTAAPSNPDDAGASFVSNLMTSHQTVDDVEITKRNMRAISSKALPSHTGPKIRHRDVNKGGQSFPSKGGKSGKPMKRTFGGRNEKMSRTQQRNKKRKQDSKAVKYLTLS